MFNLKQNIKKIMGDESGVSSMLTFLLVVFPLIVLIFAILEIANLSNTIISMNRGLMDSLVRTSTSAAPMVDPANITNSINNRWKSNLVKYLVSQGNARTQFFGAEGNPVLVPELPTDGNVEKRLLYVKIDTTLDYRFAPADKIQALKNSNIAVADSTGPPMITIKIKYRYQFIGPFLSYLLAPAEKIDSIVLSSGMTTVNEHPNYVYSE